MISMPTNLASPQHSVEPTRKTTKRNQKEKQPNSVPIWIRSRQREVGSGQQAKGRPVLWLALLGIVGLVCSLVRPSLPIYRWVVQGGRPIWGRVPLSLGTWNPSPKTPSSTCLATQARVGLADLGPMVCLTPKESGGWPVWNLQECPRSFSKPSGPFWKLLSPSKTFQDLPDITGTL